MADRLDGPTGEAADGEGTDVGTTAAGAPADALLLVCGPTRVRVGQVLHDVTNLQARLLCQLAIAAPAPLTVEQLLDALWPGDRPANARASLYNQISRMRSRLGVEIVRSIGGAYELTVGTDLNAAVAAVGEVESLSAAGEHLRAEQLAGETIGIFRGEALAELPVDDRRAEPQRRRARETVRALWTLRVEAAVAAGRTAWAVPEAERLVGETPGDERRWALLVDALRCAGRRGDAFAAWERARRHLVEQLGLGPSRVLDAAHDRLLGSDDQAPTAASPLVGREEFIAEVIGGLGPVPTLIVGESGIGKTRLLNVIANRLARSGAKVAFVTATLYPSYATQILAEIAEALEVSMAPSGSPTHAFVEALRSAVHKWGRVVVITDDAALLGAVSVAAYEEGTSVDGVSFLAASSTPISGLAHVDIRTLRIPPLTRPQVRLLAESRHGDGLHDERIEWLQQMSGGNPGLVEVLLSGGPEEPNQPLAALIEHRLGRLSSSARDTLDVLAVLNAAVPLSGLQRHVQQPVIDELLDAGILEVGSDSFVRFRHGAVRSALYASTAPGRRAESHMWVLRNADVLGLPPDVVANHAAEVASLDPLLAAQVLLDTASVGAITVPARRAKRWFRLGIELGERLATSGHPDAARIEARARIGLVEQLRRTGNPRRFEAAREAYEVAVESGDEALVASAAFELASTCAVSDDGTPDTGVAAVLAGALDRVPPGDPMRTKLTAACAFLLCADGLEHTGRHAARAALEMPGDGPTRLHVLRIADRFLFSPADLDVRHSLTEELDWFFAMVAGMASQSAAPFAARFSHLLFDLPGQLMDCNGVAARRTLAEMELEFVEGMDVEGVSRWHLYASLLAFLAGDTDGADEHLAEAGDLIDRMSDGFAIRRYWAALVPQRIAQGRGEELVDDLEQLAVAQPRISLWRGLLARCVVERDPARARRLSGSAMSSIDDRCPLWAHAVAAVAEVAAATGNVRLCSEVIDRLGPYSGQFICGGGAYGGLVDTLLAKASMVLGHYGRVAELMASAREQVRSLGAPVLAGDLDVLAERVTNHLLARGVDGAAG